MTREEVFDYIRNSYGVDPEYPWFNLPLSTVFRHKNGKKWFALIMDIKKEKLSLQSNENQVIDILNVKCDPLLIELLIERNEFFPGYHMNKKYWLSIVLESANSEEVKSLIDSSFILTLK